MDNEVFIDKTQYAGTGTENKTAVWSNWALRHMKEMRLARNLGLLGPEGADWRNVSEHLLVVNALAYSIAVMLENVGQDLDTATVDEASILHDVSKRAERERDMSYATEQTSTLKRKALEDAGFSEATIRAAEYTGRVPEIQIADETEQREVIGKTPLEQLIVAYSDARTRNVDIVSLEEARDMNKQKVPKDAALYDRWYSFYHRVEERIFSYLNINPTEINNNWVFAMLERGII